MNCQLNLFFVCHEFCFVVQNYFQAQWHKPLTGHLSQAPINTHTNTRAHTLSLSLSLSLTSRATPLRTVSTKSAARITSVVSIS